MEVICQTGWKKENLENKFHTDLVIILEVISLEMQVLDFFVF